MGRGWLAQFSRGNAEASALPGGLLQRHRRERWAAAAVALLFSFLLVLTGVSELLDNRLGDVRARLLDRAPTGQIAIVEIDARSIAALKKWPWSRRHHAELVNRLHRAGASIIAFDVDFSAQSDQSGDRAFAEALGKVQPVVLPIFQQRASDDPRERLMIKNRPAPEFGKAWVGGVNILPGSDGIVRDFPAATMINGQIQPSMAVLLSENDALGDRTFIPDWSIDAGRIPRFSFIDVLSGRVGKTALAGKRVIVGATAIELGDRYTIPRFGTVPGVVVQALAAETLIQHRALWRSGLLPTLLGLCLITLGLGSAFFRRSYPVAAAVGVFLLLAGPIAVQWRWPLSIDTGALLLAAVLAVGLRFIVEARHRIRVKDLRDAESGLPNERALEAALRGSALPTLSVTAASIDRYDQIRTALEAGALAEVIEQAVRRIALVANEQVFRIAPDTLAWLSPKDDADRIAALIGDCFLEPIVTESGAVDVHLTFGIATAAAAAGSTPLFERALAAVNAARAAGSRSQWFQGIGARERRDLSIMGDLRRGIAEGEVFVAYQPKLDLGTGAIAHAEALVRWQHPTEGLISPDRFLPLAEETGTVRELTRFVLDQVVADCSRLSEAGCKVGISVNVSAHDIGEPRFAEHVIETLRGSPLQPGQLTFEITESAIIRSPEIALQVLYALREYGIRLSVDDYGTGQSTLSYLKSLPVDELKIDKSFVTSICSNVNDRIMVRSTIEMVHELGLSVVAEGVEDSGTIDLLKQLNCDYVQGFAIGKAASRDEVWPTVFGQSRRKVA